MVQRVATVVCQLSSALYICRESSTNPPLFMQNKPNLLNAQMNVNTVITEDYENKRPCRRRQNKANTKPIKANQSQFPKSQDERKLSKNEEL